jgi:hypothetical protein
VLARRRASAGLARAKAQGVRLGRPRRRIDPAKFATVAGLPEREAARRLGVPRSTLQRLRRITYHPAFTILRRLSGDLGYVLHMSKAPKRIRDVRPPKKEHPVLRKNIQAWGWMPLVLCDANGAYWDGGIVVTPTSAPREAIHISQETQEHLITLFLEGQFGEEAKDVILDPDRWQKIYDNLINWPDEELIRGQSLRRMHLVRVSSMGSREVASSIPGAATTGPKPTSWSGTIERDADQESFTYVFRFGRRDVWKIGHAVDVSARLAEVNKHVPDEVIGEKWTLVLTHKWPNQLAAYEMEQRVLRLLRTPSSVGERVSCTLKQLEAVWHAERATR